MKIPVFLSSCSLSLQRHRYSGKQITSCPPALLDRQAVISNRERNVASCVRKKEGAKRGRIRAERAECRRSCGGTESHTLGEIPPIFDFQSRNSRWGGVTTSYFLLSPSDSSLTAKALSRRRRSLIYLHLSKEGEWCHGASSWAVTELWWGFARSLTLLVA